MADEQHGLRKTTLGFDRVVFFSDAVFAIVITILVLPLVDQVTEIDSGPLGEQVLDLWPSGLAVLISFAVIGQYWLSHHSGFGLLDAYDAGLIWLNLLGLATITFLTVPTALLGSQGDSPDRFPVVFYAAALALASGALTIMWAYALRRGFARDADDQRELQRTVVRSVTATVVCVLAIPVALLGLLPAIAMWTVVMPILQAQVERRARPGADRPEPAT